MHGGKSLAGIASPTYKDGSQSRYILPPRLRARYEAAVSDPALLEQRHEIALLDARLGALVGALDTGESTWADLLAAYGRLRSAMGRQDKPAITLALADVDRLITRGADEAVAWEQIGAVLEQRRKLVESESKRLKDAQQTLTVEQAMFFMNAVLVSVQTHVQDRDARMAIQSDMIRLTTRQNDVIDVPTDA